MTLDQNVNHSLVHPNVHDAAEPWSEAAVLHVAAAYSNTRRWDRRRELFTDFRREMTASPNVKLYVGELAYGERPFEVTQQSQPGDIQFRTSAELWHKENILNQVISRFDPDWQYGAYVDGDFHFTRRDWALEAVHLLQHFDFVQLFSSYSDLSPDQRPMTVTPSFAYNYFHKGVSPRSYRAGATGGAWAFRRSAFNTVGGLLDTCILGSGDWYMAFGLAGEPDDHPETKRCGQDYIHAIRAWQDRAAELRRNFGYLENHAVHHFHGSKNLRDYGTRWKILMENDFNPCADLSRDWQGIYQLTPNKPNLRDGIRNYFEGRNEDDLTLKGPREQPLV